MDIPALEYEQQRRHAFDLCRWINGNLTSMEATGHLDDIYFERKGQNIKRLIEEAIPISRLALRWCVPGSEAFVTFFSEGEPYDAQIDIEGASKRSFRVEVTTTETNETTMRRQALARYGNVSLTGSIRREGRTLIDTPEMVNMQEEDERLSGLALRRMQAKVASDRYTPGTAILVYVTQPRPLSLDARADLVRRTSAFLHSSQSGISEVYYCYAVGLDLDAVKVRT